MDKKEILKALEEHFGVKPKYLGVPSFAYEIQTSSGEVYLVDREGKIKNKVGYEIELQSLLRQAEPKVEATLTSQVILPMDGHTGVTLRNLVNMINSKQGLIKKALGLEADIVRKEFVEGINEARLIDLEDFETAAAAIGLEELEGLEFDFRGKTVSFKFLDNLPEVKIQEKFAMALSEGAKKIKYSSYKETETDNDKFTMRTWLIRIGFIGPEYKKAREALLKNLEGNGAFRKVKVEAE